jgi:protein gp37
VAEGVDSNSRYRFLNWQPFEKGFARRLVREKIAEPLRWRNPLRVFVNSMSDLFHDLVPTRHIADVGRVMRNAHWHTCQVLTKRHERMHQLLSGELGWLAALPNVWFGMSVEDREYGILRIDLLRCTPARIRFLSIEPCILGTGARARLRRPRAWPRSL